MTPQLRSDEIISRLRSSQSELKRLGCLHLSLFGSVARGEQNEASDIDLAVIYDRSKVRTLLDQGAIAFRIEKILGGSNFDLADEERFLPHMMNTFQRDHIRIF